MWPSEDWASKLYDLANWGLIAGLVVGVISTGLLVWMGKVKEEYLKRDLAATIERAANAEHDGAEAKKAAADADTKAEGFRLNIANANERAAALEVQALKLRGQLLWQGPRGNLLAGENRHKLVDALKAFSGQRIDVRHSATAIMVNGAVVMSTPIGDDALGLANALIGVLKEAGWNLPPTPLISGFQGHGTEVEILHKASRETRAAAEALVEALRQVPLTVVGPSPITDGSAKRTGTEVILPPFDENTIILVVLTHP